MGIGRLIPETIRGRYSAKITASLAGVFALTVGVVVLFTMHILQTERTVGGESTLPGAETDADSMVAATAD